MATLPPIIVRAVQPADTAVWEDLREALWSGERDRHRKEIASFFAGTLREPVAVLLAETATGDIVGVVELSLRTDIPGLLGQRTGYIEGLYVLPSRRFQGVARCLLQNSKDWALREGCQAFASDRDDRIIVDRSFRDLPATQPS